ncbi:MAG: DUF309 domain-containing protein, partial [Anaerolineae bacterium]|nr:DUF309 domain-containing protein [Anaerolineae bacterium]
MKEPTKKAGPVVVTGEPEWGAVAQEAARRQGFDMARYAVELPDEAILSRLAQDHAAMLLVDGRLAAWRRWVVVPVTSPATRRIPVVLVTDDLALLDAALDAGAAYALRGEELEEMLPRLLAAQGRVQDADHMAALACQCATPLPPEGQEAIRLFNAGEYYRQHDLFEALWMAESGPVRNLYRAILQIGVGYYHIRRGNHRGALKMLLRSLQWLTPL